MVGIQPIFSQYIKLYFIKNCLNKMRHITINNSSYTFSNDISMKLKPMSRNKPYTYKVTKHI